VPDEELGSPGSRRWIEEACRGANAVLVLEPTRPKGGVVVGRRAVGSVRAYYTGRSAHAAVNHAEGASAVRAAARATLALEALTDTSRKPGRQRRHPARRRRAAGGAARGRDARRHPRRAARGRGAHSRTTSRSSSRTGDPRVSVRIEAAGRGRCFRNLRPAVYKLAERFAAEIGAPIHPVVSSGGSDGSFAGAMGVPTLDGLGPICFDTCSRREKIVIASLAERGALFGALIDAISAAPSG
jgi:glutamate carboxypeptidase